MVGSKFRNQKKKFRNFGLGFGEKTKFKISKIKYFEIFEFRKNFEILIRNSEDFEILLRKFDILKFVSENLELTEKAFN